MIEIISNEIEEYRKKYLKNFYILEVFVFFLMLITITFFYILSYEGEIRTISDISSDIFILFIFFLGSFIFVSYRILVTFSKKFSFFAKSQIFKYLLKNQEFAPAELISYTPTPVNLNFRTVLIQKFKSPLDIGILSSLSYIYEEEDVFKFKMKNVIIIMAEVILYHTGSENRTLLFRGIAYKIPQEYAKSTNSEEIIKYEQYAYIFVPKKKNLFEFSLLKKITSSLIEGLIKEVNENIRLALAYIKTDKL